MTAAADPPSAAPSALTDGLAGADAPAAFCYVVLAHTDPDGLRRLLRRLRELSPQAWIVLRYDAADLIDPDEVVRLGAIPLVSDIRVSWGSWTMVEAMLEALRFARQRTPACWFVVVSGQDYPVRALSDWERDVSAGTADALLAPMPMHPQTHRYRWGSFRTPLRDRPRVSRVLQAVLTRIGQVAPGLFAVYRLERTGPHLWWVRLRRRGGALPADYLRKASQWLTVSGDVLDRVLAEARQGSRRTRYLRSTLIPDEIFVQSLIAVHAHEVDPAPTSAMRFADEAVSPDWLTPELVAELTADSAAPFVRKMPPGAGPDLIAAADRRSGAHGGDGRRP